jgi:hypothetical protein
MTVRHAPLLVLTFLALMVVGRAQQPSTSAGTPLPPAFTGVIELPRQIVVLEPTRSDISVGSVEFVLYNPAFTAGWLDAVRVNGLRPRTTSLHLRQIAKNAFEFPALRIEFSPSALGGPLYLAVKAWFNELTSQQELPYYENLPDRYALLTYCTNENDDPSGQNARFGANRAKTLDAFIARLGEPIVIRLNQKPLPEGGVRWPMVNDLPLGRLSDADLAAIQQLVRDRGERYLISIAVRAGANADEATLLVGERNHFEGARAYRLVRNGTTWRTADVAKVESGM